MAAVLAQVEPVPPNHKHKSPSGDFYFTDNSCPCCLNNAYNKIIRFSITIMTETDNQKLTAERDQYEELSKALFEKSSRAFVLLDASFKILNINNEFRSLFFFFNHDLIGKEAQVVLKTPINQYIKNHLSDLNSDFFSYDAIMNDGLSLTRHVTCIVTEMDKPTRYLIEFIDKTEAIRNTTASKLIGAVQNGLLNTGSEKELMELVVNAIIEIGHFHFTFIGLISDDDVKTVVPVAYAGHEDGYLKQIRINMTDPDLQKGPSVKAILQKKPSITRDTESDPNFLPWRTEALKRGYKSVISIPLFYLDQPVIGIINLYSPDINAFDSREVELLVRMASALAFGITMKRFQENLKLTTAELDQSLEKMKRVIGQTVGALSTTIEYRDPFTHDHQKRVAQLAKALVEEMNLGLEKAHEITVAAHLHDLGKVTVPESILNKPGLVTSEEFELVKKHSQAGYDIIKEVEFPWPIADIVLQHHEKINGSGYPLGLKGYEILMSARILCVADVIEAMISDRPHRKAKTIEEALSEIRTNKGILYDPDVVEACLRLFEQKHFRFDENRH